VTWYNSFSPYMSARRDIPMQLPDDICFWRKQQHSWTTELIWNGFAAAIRQCTLFQEIWKTNVLVGSSVSTKNLTKKSLVNVPITTKDFTKSRYIECKHYKLGTFTTPVYIKSSNPFRAVTSIPNKSMSCFSFSAKSYINTTVVDHMPLKTNMLNC